MPVWFVSFCISRTKTLYCYCHCPVSQHPLHCSDADTDIGKHNSQFYGRFQVKQHWFCTCVHCWFSIFYNKFTDNL